MSFTLTVNLSSPRALFATCHVISHVIGLPLYSAKVTELWAQLGSLYEPD